MRRGLLFAVLSSPVVAWPCIHLWAQATADAWTPSAGDLSLLVRLGLYVDNWAIRFAPIAIIAVVVLAPFIVLGISAFIETFSRHTVSTRRDVLIWWCVSAAIGGLLAILLGALALTATFPVLFLMFWMASVAFWLSLAAAYVIQRGRRITTPSTWHPGWLLGLAAFGNLGGLGYFLLPVLAVTVLPRDDFRSGAAG